MSDQAKTTFKKTGTGYAVYLDGAGEIGYVEKYRERLPVHANDGGRTILVGHTVSTRWRYASIVTEATGNGYHSRKDAVWSLVNRIERSGYLDEAAKTRDEIVASLDESIREARDEREAKHDAVVELVESKKIEKAETRARTALYEYAALRGLEDGDYGSPESRRLDGLVERAIQAIDDLADEKKGY